MKNDRPSSMPASPDAPQPLAAAAPNRGGDAPLRSEALLLGRSSVTIAHEGMHYVLRATRAGKLILTK